MPEGRKSGRLKALLNVVNNPSAYPPEAVVKAVAGLVQIETIRQRLVEVRYRQSVKGKRDAAAAARATSRDVKNFTL